MRRPWKLGLVDTMYLGTTGESSDDYGLGSPDWDERAKEVKGRAREGEGGGETGQRETLAREEDGKWVEGMLEERRV